MVLVVESICLLLNKIMVHLINKAVDDYSLPV